MSIPRRSLLQAAAPALLAAQSSPQRPNILVIVLDDLGCTDLGYLGATDLRTPHLDRIASQSAILDNWYSNAPVCAPARAAILTGRYPSKAGVASNGGNLIPGIPNLGRLFQSAGYQTAAIGKWHLGLQPASLPNAQGFRNFYGFLNGCIDFYSHRFYWGEPNRPNFHDLWRNTTEIFEDGRYFTERITEETVAFLDANPRDPFCAYVAFNAPHYPMHAPDSYMQRFAHLPLERRTYAAMIAAVDDGIGSIRATLERQGRWQNTLLFFTGDNGATTEKRAGLDGQYATAGSNGKFRGFKFSVFDGGTHIPGFIHWPGRIRPRRVSQLGQAMDILPTALDFAGLTLPAALDGHSLRRVLEDNAPTPHQALYWANQGQTAVRRGDWKLVINGKDFDRRPEGNQSLTGDDALFLSNLAEDPSESRNLRKQNPQLVDELSTLAAQWQSSLEKK